MSKKKVLIVDDSALIRQMLSEMLNSDPDLEVVGVASDPYAARDKIKQLNPDVITLDVEMPRMDGVTFLENLMRLHPMPVVMVSSLTQRGAEVTLRALELGAIDFVAKPKIDLAGTLRQYTEELVAKVKVAAVANVTRRHASVTTHVQPKFSADAVLPSQQRSRGLLRTTEKIVAIGASTGGTEALRELLGSFPPDAPAMVVSQHIPAAFSKPFAERLDNVCAMKVFHAEDGQYIVPGHVYVAPGDRHLLIDRDGARYVCRLSDGPPVNRHRPSVDVMFRSVAQKVGPNAIGVILTGMGDDGARGLKEMLDAGARTVAQDEASSVVWGMPGSAVKLGAAERVESLHNISNVILELAATRADNAAAG